MEELLLTTTIIHNVILTPALDGSHGSNRSHGGISQISANNDVDAIQVWLNDFRDSPHTLRSYRKEALRLLVWTTQVLGKPIASLSREDLQAFEDMLVNPPLEWCDPARPRSGASRRLITGPMSPRSVRQTMGILSNLFNYLVSAGYLSGNPLVLRRKRGISKSASSAAERYLDYALWQLVLNHIETLPQATRSEQQHYERSRWLFRLLYGTALRVSEAALAKSCDLTQRRGKWWLHVVGKGGSEGDVPISDELMADLARYRRFYGMQPLPMPLETSPLVMSVTGRCVHLTPTAIYLMVKEIFKRTAATLESSDPAGAGVLQRASTHWVRHTSATHQADAGNDIRYIQKNLRHASIETTSIYLHAEDDQRHEKTTTKQK